jgi:uncharacterized protein involved in cysteine biosynthesis
VALLAAAFGIGGFLLAGSLAPDLAEPWPGWIEWARGAAAWAGEALIRTAGGLLGVFLGIAVSGVVTAPLLDLLSERVEAAALGRVVPGRPWSYFAGDSLRALRAAAFLLLVQAAVLAPLFVLSFTAVGAPIFAAAGAWFAGFSAADFVLGRKRLPGRERLGWALRRPAFLLGMGTPLAFVPPLLPFAVVGSTLAYLEERGSGAE